MPTVFTVAGLRFFFYSNEGAEPPHVHVEKGDAIGKWWLANLQQDYASGFTKADSAESERCLSNGGRS